MKLYILFLLFLFQFLSSSEMVQVKEGYAPCTDGKIFYRAIGKGEPIVIIHGGPGLDHSYFLPSMDVLAANHLVIYYDQRGTGKSYCDINCETVNMDSFVEDLENLRKHLKLKKFTILGHSWGTLLGIEYALRYSDHVNSLILMNSLPATNQGLERYYENLGEKLKPISDHLVQIEISESFKNRTPNAVREYLQLIFPKYFCDENKILLLNGNFCNETATNFFRVGELLDNDYLGEYDLLDRLKTCTIPVLIVHGDNDPVPRKYAEQLHKYLKRSELVVINGSGHFPFIEQPIMLFKSIRKFLKNYVPNPSQQDAVLA